MRILVTGAHGLIGSSLIPALRAAGHGVEPVTRDGHHLDLSDLADADGVVHLAGAGIGDERWTPERKAEVLESRTIPTRQLAEAMAALPDPGRRVLVSASAIGFYGNRGDEVLTEKSVPGEGFLAEICKQWEAATQLAEVAGVRVVRLRSGIVMTPKGGALKQLLLPFKLGLGGPIGSGKQWFSWISIDDEIGAIVHALTNPSVKGPMNATAPNPVTYSEFAKTLGRVLHRPAFLPTPKFAPALKIGREATEEMLLAGQRALPKMLETSGYTFAAAELESALKGLLG
jgi:uncharacterized protein